MPIIGGSALTPRQIHGFLQNHEEICIDTAVNTGNADVWGAWTELLAATVADIYAVILGAPEAVIANEALQVELGIGAGAAEVAIALVGVGGWDGTEDWGFSGPVTIPVHIPAGSRVALRSMSRTAGPLTLRWTVDGLTE